MPDLYYAVESLEPDRSVGFLIKRCGVLMNQIAERSFGSQPISFTQWTVLMTLTQCTHTSPTELSTHMGHDMGALTRLVDELQREGLVRRERSEHDRRAVEIAITAEGRRVANAAKRIVVDLLNQLVEPYSREEVDALIVLLQKILARMQSLEASQSQVAVPSVVRSQANSSPTRAHAKGRRTAKRKSMD